jgi:predicted ribosomally synthesized peptide with SipW-like signal peptide
MDDLLAEFERPRQVSPEDRERRRRLFAAFGIAGLSLVAIGSLTTNALFTDQESVSAGFTTGTIDLAAGPATVDFNADNMAPGDEVFGSINVENQGTLQLRYAATATATDADGKDLRGQLDFTVFSDVTPAQCNAGNVGGGTQLGTSGPINAGRGMFGDPSVGAQGGDRVLNAAADEDLCVRATLPLGTGNAFQDATTDVTFVFQAEQTKNN